MDQLPLVVFRAEVGYFPFWTFDGVGLDYGFFPLSPDLVARLQRWCVQLWDVIDGSEPAPTWRDLGYALFQEAAAAMAAAYELSWDPDNDEMDE